MLQPTNRSADGNRKWVAALLCATMLLLGAAVVVSVRWTTSTVRHSVQQNDRKFCDLLGGISQGPRAATPYGRHQQDAVARLYRNLGCLSSS